HEELAPNIGNIYSEYWNYDAKHLDANSGDITASVNGSGQISNILTISGNGEIAIIDEKIVALPSMHVVSQFAGYFPSSFAKLNYDASLFVANDAEMNPPAIYVCTDPLNRVRIGSQSSYYSFNNFSLD